MFGFFKKKGETSDQKQSESLPVLSEERRLELLDKVAEEKETLSTLKESEQLADTYEKIGLIYSELGQTDSAIENLEKSLEVKLSMGDGYKKLMSLYNLKRAEAAKNRDNDGIDYYMAKMDDMRNIAKKVTLSR